MTRAIWNLLTSKPLALGLIAVLGVLAAGGLAGAPWLVGSPVAAVLAALAVNTLCCSISHFRATRVFSVRAASLVGMHLGTVAFLGALAVDRIAYQEVRLLLTEGQTIVPASLPDLAADRGPFARAALPGTEITLRRVVGGDAPEARVDEVLVDLEAAGVDPAALEARVGAAGSLGGWSVHVADWGYAPLVRVVEGESTRWEGYVNLRTWRDASEARFRDVAAPGGTPVALEYTPGSPPVLAIRDPGGDDERRLDLRPGEEGAWGSRTIRFGGARRWALLAFVRRPGALPALLAGAVAVACMILALARRGTGEDAAVRGTAVEPRSEAREPAPAP